MHEQDEDWGSSGANPELLISADDASGVTVVANFTDFHAVANDQRPIWSTEADYDLDSLQLNHCRIFNGSSQFESGSSANHNFFNTLFRRGFVNFKGDAAVDCSQSTFYGATADYDQDGTATWTFNDNAFIDYTYSSLSISYLSDSYNAWVNSDTYRFTPAESTDVVVNGAFNLTAGAFGEFYQDTSSNSLLDAGSASASSLGLYHFTLRTDDQKETTTTVDMGLHYVAADTNGHANDKDGDGVPDYIEDTDGDGAHDAGETDWEDSENGTTGVPGLQVFTALE